MGARGEILKLEAQVGKNSIALEEVTEVISLPSFDSAVYKKGGVKVAEEVRQQLLDFIHTVASMYCENPFHKYVRHLFGLMLCADHQLTCFLSLRSFDHASHVAQSVSKLLSRIVAIKELDDAKDLHDHTYGITSDPLTQFAIVFSSLIHGKLQFCIAQRKIKSKPTQCLCFRRRPPWRSQCSTDEGGPRNGNALQESGCRRAKLGGCGLEPFDGFEIRALAWCNLQ